MIREQDLGLLAKARLASHMTQEEMSCELGVSIPVVVKLEKHPNMINVERLSKWYHACSAEGKAIVEKLIDEQIFFDPKQQA